MCVRACVGFFFFFAKRFAAPTRRGGKFNILRVGTSLAAQREIPPRLVLRQCRSVIVAGV